ncbi:hypothetical protein J437_LFUL002387 [Ladona fulva]|uniref:Uncharacterized protein n=1 Tax=Ladona fulva TaxID=123851 RepID=A0A8K0K3W2_LADFU|nr:hypothetical protein J437_LFUL002387 [Ladona fulva]
MADLVETSGQRRRKTVHVSCNYRSEDKLTARDPRWTRMGTRSKDGMRLF